MESCGNEARTAASFCAPSESVRLFDQRKNLLAVICLVCTGLVLTAMCFSGERGFGWLGRWELRFRDWLVKHGQRATPDPRLMFVGIDNDSVSIEEVDLDSLFADIPRDSAD